VEIVLADSGIPELHIYKLETRELVDVYQLHDITDVVMVGSKTHAHAFEIKSGDTSVLVMSGTTELSSREWIWTFKKLFWPQTIPTPSNNGMYRQSVFCISVSDTVTL